MMLSLFNRVNQKNRQRSEERKNNQIANKVNFLTKYEKHFPVSNGSLHGIEVRIVYIYLISFLFLIFKIENTFCFQTFSTSFFNILVTFVLAQETILLLIPMKSKTQVMTSMDHQQVGKSILMLSMGMIESALIQVIEEVSTFTYENTVKKYPIFL